MAEVKRFSLVKPSVDTPFHIDFAWWKKNERDWHVYLLSLLCAEHQDAFANVEEGEMIDWIDPKTAEVKPVEGVQNALMTHCVKQPDFLTNQTALVEAVFRLFISNGNVPLSSGELGAKLNRPPEIILRTLASARVYKGIKPYRS
jgi:hypothetical protein